MNIFKIIWESICENTISKARFSKIVNRVGYVAATICVLGSASGLYCLLLWLLWGWTYSGAIHPIYLWFYNSSKFFQVLGGLLAIVSGIAGLIWCLFLLLCWIAYVLRIWRTVVKKVREASGDND